MRWTESTLGRIVENGAGLIQTGPFGSQLHQSDYQPEGIPVIMPKDIFAGTINCESVARVSEETADRLQRHRLIPRTIVVPRRGEITKRALIKAEQAGWLCGTGCLQIVLSAKVLLPEFLYYFMEQEKVVRWLEQHAVGTTMLNLSASIVSELPIRYPDPQTQQAIAEMLSAYDDLIENNQRRMALLEESARLLYREWFVRLCFPGREHTPIVNGLPEGWKNIQLSSIINVMHGFAFQGEHFSELPTARVLTTPGNFKVGGGAKIDKLKFYSDEGPLDPQYVLTPMDLILTMTDLSKMGDTLGFPAFVPALDSRSFLHNQRVGKVVPLGQFFPKHFLYCLFCDDRYRHHVVGAATGTSVKHTSPKRILSYVTALPSREGLISSFETLVGPLFQQVNCLLATNEKLRAARDLLLPRLMNGELTV